MFSIVFMYNLFCGVDVWADKFSWAEIAMGRNCHGPKLTWADFVMGRNDPEPFWVRCTINRSHSTPCKMAEFEHLQIFPGHCLDFFLSVSGKICHSPIKKVKRQPTLIISFSQHSPFFGEQSKNPG